MIDVLLGVEIFCNLIRAGHIKLCENLLILQETELGSVISGPVSSNQIPAITIYNLTVITIEPIENQLQKLLTVEEYHDHTSFSRSNRI